MPIEGEKFHADRLDRLSIAAVRTCASLIRLSSTFGDLSKYKRSFKTDVHRGAV